MVQVRESSRFGFCYALGELIGETPTRYIYRNRAGTAFVSKKLIDPPRAVRGVRGLSGERRGGLGHQLAKPGGREGGRALTPTNQNRAPCDWHHRPHRPKRTHSPAARGDGHA